MTVAKLLVKSPVCSAQPRTGFVEAKTRRCLAYIVSQLGIEKWLKDQGHEMIVSVFTCAALRAALDCSCIPVGHKRQGGSQQRLPEGACRREFSRFLTAPALTPHSQADV